MSNTTPPTIEAALRKFASHEWLKPMVNDSYYPSFLVDKIIQILQNVFRNIEAVKPTTLEQLYEITNQGVREINDLEDEFDQNESEIETMARDAIGDEFYFIIDAFGFKDADLEEAIRDREW